MGQTFSGPPFGPPYLNGPFYPRGFTPASALQINQQNNVTQELRLQLDDPNGRVDWVVGFFYQHAGQTSDQLVSDPQLSDFVQQLTGLPFAAFFGQHEWLRRSANAPKSCRRCISISNTPRKTQRQQ